MKALFTFLFAALFLGLSAQDSKKADRLLFNENWDGAIEEYNKLLNEDPENITFNYNIGVAYVSTYYDQIKAIPHLEKVVYYDKYISNAYYYMGRAYHYNQQFDEALEMYTRFKNYASEDEIYALEVDRQIEYCENAKELLKFPLQLTYENLGPNINSPEHDFFPFIPQDESYIIYNSRRDDGSKVQRNGLFMANVYYSPVVEGKFAPAFPLENINTDNGNELVIGLSANGEKVLLHFDNDDQNYDATHVYLSNVLDGDLSKPKKLDENVETENDEIAVSITDDSRTIYFAADLADGYGGLDLYRTRMLPTGEFGVPENLGPTINTEYDEDFPYITPDEKTLYFSSKGHFSMGGYDIFKAQFNTDSNAFSFPRNLGYPLNTLQDDMNFRMSESGRYGYIAAVRPDGFGKFDIYRVIFESIQAELTVLKGHVKNEVGSADISDATISITDNVTAEVIGNYLPNPKSKRFTIILPPGNYNILVEASGYEPISEDVDVLGKGSFEPELDREFVLRRSN